MGAVDGLGKNTCARGLAHTAGSAEQVGMSQTVGGHGVFERRGQGLLPHNRCESRRAVFSSRN